MMQGESQMVSSMFLGGIPPEATLKDVTEAVRCVVGKFEGWSLELKGKSDKSSHLGFGFLHCETEEAAALFKQIPAFLVKGKKVECKEGWSIEEHKKRTNQERQKKIFVSCIKKNTKKNIIIDYFSVFGPVLDVVIGKDKTSGRKLGFCIVEFDSEQSVPRVLAVENHILQNKEIKCQKMLLKHELGNKPIFKTKPDFFPSSWSHDLKFQTFGVQKEINTKPGSESNQNYKQASYHPKLNYDQHPFMDKDFPAPSNHKGKPFISNVTYQSSSKQTQPYKQLGSQGEFRYLPRKPAQSLKAFPPSTQFPPYDCSYTQQENAYSKAPPHNQRSPAVTSNPYNVNTSFAYFPDYNPSCSEQQPPLYYSSVQNLGGLHGQVGSNPDDQYPFCAPTAFPKLTYAQEAYVHHATYDKGQSYGYPQTDTAPQTGFGTHLSHGLPRRPVPATKKDNIMRASEGDFGKVGEFKGRQKPPLKPNSLSSLPGPVESP